jgi:hypothetical protein
MLHSSLLEFLLSLLSLNLFLFGLLSLCLLFGDVTIAHLELVVLLVLFGLLAQGFSARYFGDTLFLSKLSHLKLIYF